MDKDDLIEEIDEALVNWMDDGPNSVVASEKIYPGPALKVKFADGTEWIITAVEA